MSPLTHNPDRRFLLALGSITLLGFVLRLNGLWSESFTADEVDTVIRVNESHSVGYLLDFWVRHDGHPPFTHLLEYYWTMLFGFSEGAIRFPFALLGAGAAWFAGRTAHRWFGEGSGLATAAGVAFLQFPIMYSQLARPYAPGLFFSMLLVWFWTKCLFSEKPKRLDFVLFAVAGLGAAYSHYFSLLLAGLIGMAGVFFLRKDTWKPYLLSGAAIVALFLPYIGIFLFQLDAGGVGGPGGWLGKPTPAFFGQHLWFIFDESRIILYGSLLLAAVTMVLFFRRPGKFHLLALFLWATPLVIGYLYSQKSPVLQNSVLLFSFPFLLMLLFAWMPPPGKWKWTPAIPAAFALVLLAYVTVYKPFHLTDHFGRLEEIAEATLEWESKFCKDDKENLACTFNVDYPYYLEYYWEKAGRNPEQVLAYRNGGFSELRTLRESLRETRGEYFVYGWSTVYSPVEILPIIRERFPVLVEKREWYNSAVYLFKTAGSGDTLRPGPFLFYSFNDFWLSPVVKTGKDSLPAWTEPCGERADHFVFEGPYWESHPVNGDTTNLKWEWTPHVKTNYDIRLDSSCIYSPSLKLKVGDVLPHPDNQVLFTANAKLPDTNATLILVIEFQRDGKQLHWNGMESTTQVDRNNTQYFQPIYFGLYLPPDLRATDTVHFYCYTKTGAPVIIDYLEVKTLEGHRGIYGPRPAYE